MITNAYSNLGLAYRDLTALIEEHGGQIMNAIIQIPHMNEPENYTYETELFPKEALQAYSDWNMERGHEHFGFEDRSHLFTPLRGGPQGDYRQGMRAKLEKVVLALKTRPGSKRAVLTIPFTDKCSLCVGIKDDAEWKCLREIYFSIRNGKLDATSVMRSQALIILPKNVFMIGEIMNHIATELGLKAGTLTHIMHFLVEDRK
jgi:thymidylate synthase